MTDYGLGRLPAPDARDQNFPLRAALPAVGLTGYKNWWDSGAWLNQGSTGTCVAHAWSHWVEDSPMTPGGTIDPFQLYRECCLLDGWPQNDGGDLNFGTSVRAGAQALMNRSMTSEYLWAFDVQTVIDAVMVKGPVVMGTTWYNSMFTPVRRRDAAGDYRLMLNVDENSGVAGGHAWVINGVNTVSKTFRMKNSWGRGWGADGRARISFVDLGKLMADAAEACMAVQRTP